MRTRVFTHKLRFVRLKGNLYRTNPNLVETLPQTVNNIYNCDVRNTAYTRRACVRCDKLLSFRNLS